MKIGNKVELVKEISYPAKDDYDQPYTAALAKGTKGIVANIVDAGGEMLVFFNPIDTETIFAVSKDSVKKSK